MLNSKIYSMAITFLIFLMSSTTINANSFGQTTRYQWNNWPVIPYPLDRVGTLKHPNGSRCTASYIGDNYLLTAAHCVMKTGKNELQKGDYLFEHIQLPNGRYWDSRKITRFHFVELKQLELEGYDATKNHWVILETNSPIESPKNYFGYSYPGDSKYDEWHDSNYNLSIVGYAPDFNGDTKQLTFSDGNCEIKAHVFDGMVALHDCDSGPRDSGAPIYTCSGTYGNWSKCNISAIHVAAFSNDGREYPYYSDYNANIAVTMKSFKKAFYYLRIGGERPHNLISVDNY